MQLLEKKITFYNDVLENENPAAVRCMDYITEWENFRNILKGATYE